MQPGPVPEDIDSILSRFHNWADKRPAANGNGSGHGNGNGSDGVHEIAYEEAMRQHRSRRATQATPSKPAVRRKAGPRQASPAAPAASVPAQELAPRTQKKAPFVPSLELLAALRSGAVPAAHEAGAEAIQPILFREEPEPAARPAVKAGPAPSAPPPVSTIPPAPKKAVPAAKSHAAASREAVIGATAQSSAAAAAIAPRPKARSVRPAQQIKAAPTAERGASARAPAGGPAKVVPPAIHAKPATVSRRRVAPKSAISARAGSISAAKRRKPRPAAFRQVLTNTIQQPRLPESPRNKGVPDRTRRITTRFTAAEERRIGKQASQLGLTVSAYLRHCALATVTPAEPAPAPGVFAPRTKTPQKPAQGSYPPNPYATQGSSLIGGWLALLRNRFLGPPIQFSDDA